MRARPFQGEVVEGCIIRVSPCLRPRASALAGALAGRMKARGHEAVAYDKGRYAGRCRFRFGERLYEVYVQENVSNDGSPGTEGRMTPTGWLYMGVRLGDRLHKYWSEPEGKQLEDTLDDLIVELERDIYAKADGEQSLPWQNLRKIVDDGGSLEIHGGGPHLDIASLHEDEQLICMFFCKRMNFEEIMEHLEALAKRYNEKGMVTDEVNGSEYCVW